MSVNTANGGLVQSSQPLHVSSSFVAILLRLVPAGSLKKASVTGLVLPGSHHRIGSNDGARS